MSTWQTFLDRGFRRAFREIEYLEDEMNERRGFFMFQWHTYTKNELLQSPHHAKIDSITGKIGNDITSWHKNGQISDEGKEVYEENKYRIEEELHQVNRKIRQRKNTWLDEAFCLLDKFVVKVMNNMPPLIRHQLGFASFVVGFFSGSRRDNPRLLKGGSDIWE